MKAVRLCLLVVGLVGLTACSRPTPTPTPIAEITPDPPVLPPSPRPDPTPNAVTPARPQKMAPALPAPAPHTAKLLGRLSFPSEFIPNGEIRAENRFTGEVFKAPFRFKGNVSNRFQLRVPPGTYAVVFCAQERLPVEALSALPPEEAEANIEVQAGQAVDLGTLVPYDWPECKR